MSQTRAVHIGDDVWRLHPTVADEIERLRARVAELEQECSTLAAYTCDEPRSTYSGYVKCDKAERIAALEADRERLDWLEDDAVQIQDDRDRRHWVCLDTSIADSAKTLREAIDAARGETTD